MNLRYNISCFLLWLSSILKSAGKIVRSKDKTIVCDMLTLPGWFVLDSFLIYQEPIFNSKIFKNGFSWKCYKMPDEWNIQMNKLKEK